MKPTHIIWWRYGKEYDEQSFRVSSPAKVAEYLDQKVARAWALPPEQQRCWEVDGELLVEQAKPDGHHFGLDTRFHYLVRHGLLVIENLHFEPPNDHWTWFIHVADIYFDPARQCWTSQDLFADIRIDRTGRQSQVHDLDDTATALDLGLLTPAQAGKVLRTTQAAVGAIERGEFPFAEVVRGQAACRELGWPG